MTAHLHTEGRVTATDSDITGCDQIYAPSNASALKTTGAHQISIHYEVLAKQC